MNVAPASRHPGDCDPAAPERAGAAARAAAPSPGADVGAGPAGLAMEALPPGADPNAQPPGCDGAAGHAAAGRGAPPRRHLGAGSVGGHRRQRRGAVQALVVFAVVAVAAGGAAWLYSRSGTSPSAAVGSTRAAQVATDLARATSVVAIVDDQPVLEGELASLLGSGVDRAVAIDRTINKVLAAEAARARWADDARTLAAVAEREVLANLYLQRRTQEIAQAITDAQVADHYHAHVRDEDFAAFRLRYYLTRDPADAASVRALVDRGDKAALARLQPLGRGGDGFLSVQGIPYGLGQVVRRARAGDVIGPVLVRDGLLVLLLDDVRAGSKPPLDAVSAEIRTLLADRQLGEELLGLRRKAHVRLH